MTENSRSTYLSIALYLLVLAAAAFAAWHPVETLWGVGFLAYLDSVWRIGLIAFALIWAALAMWLGPKLTVDPTNTTDQSIFIPAIGHVAVMTLLFILFRSEAHFLGDGYTVLASLASETPIVKERALGEILTRLWIRDIFGGAEESAALAAFRVVAVTCGVLYLGLTWWLSHRLMKTRLQRTLLAVGLGTPGFILLYFGYVEYYAILSLATAIFALTGLAAVKGRLPRWVPVLPALVAMFSHVFGFLLLPALLYVLLSGTSPGNRIKKTSPVIKATAALAVLIAGLYGGWYAYNEWVFFRLAILLPWETRFTVHGYTLFSLAHLRDILNLVLCALPAIMVLLPLLLGEWKNRGPAGRSMWFFGILIFTCFGALFLFDPKIGMPRDWDLFSFAIIPLSAGAFYAAVRLIGARPGAATVVLLAAGINAFLLVPRVALQNDREAALEQFRDYVTWEPLKNRNSLVLILDYYNEIGDVAEAHRELTSWDRIYPEFAKNKLGLSYLDEAKYRQALQTFREIVGMNPAFVPGYSNTGATLVYMGQPDSALSWLEIALGMNPNNPAVLTDYGQALWMTERHDKAAEAWHKALKIDSTEDQAALGLMNYYGNEGDTTRYYQFLALAARYGDAPPGPLRRLGEYYLRRGHLDKARPVFREAASKGLDSTYIESLRVRFPRLGL